MPENFLMGIPNSLTVDPATPWWANDTVDALVNPGSSQAKHILEIDSEHDLAFFGVVS